MPNVLHPHRHWAGEQLLRDMVREVPTREMAVASVRLPTDVLERIRRAAEREHVPYTVLIRWILSRPVRQWPDENPTPH
ncbi:MAG: hypothetical protein AB1609_13020 [Bacillota bacterium]